VIGGRKLLERIQKGETHGSGPCLHFTSEGLA
jgi:hypothetical protein